MRPVFSAFLPALCFLLLSGRVDAQGALRDFGEIADGLQAQVSPVAMLVTAVAFVLGIASTVSGAMRLRRAGHQPGATPGDVGGGLAMIAVGAALVALPSVISSGVLTIFGVAAPTTDAFGTGNVVPFR